MTLEEALRDHAELTAAEWRVDDDALTLATKIGVRGAPRLDDALGVVREGLARGRADLGAAGALLDATGAQGPIAALARSRGLAARVLVQSAAARAAALGSGAADGDVVEGFPWDLPPRGAQEVWWRPATDRGQARLVAELDAWARALAADGTLWAVWHKDEGGQRAERLAQSRFGSVEVVNRASGWRLVALRDPLDDVAAPDVVSTWQGPDGAMRSVVGVYGGAKLDPGTAVLLAALEPLAEGVQGARVLDLGCGSGVLARRAVALGAAEVLAVDDDLAAVRSTREGVPGARVVWSDLLTRLDEPLGVDVVLMNPPFHVGRQVVGALSRAFVAAALSALAPTGRLLMVANAALPYERDLSAWATWRACTPVGERRFKVLEARRR
jgi:16S rRNA (guanine1207-N2)-methyltransferase